MTFVLHNYISLTILFHLDIHHITEVTWVIERFSYDFKCVAQGCNRLELSVPSETEPATLPDHEF